MGSQSSESILVGYRKAWVKTFCLVGALVGALFVGGDAQARKLSIIASSVFLLCIPGFFLVCHALDSMHLIP